MKTIHRGIVIGREPKYQALGMLVDATIQEKSRGFPGWCNVPHILLKHMPALQAEGLVEQWGERHDWWRATKTAIAKHRRVTNAPLTRM